MPYKSENGRKWDWHIVPGFSMAYTPNERELLIDETMRKFKEVFGYYPKTIASWVIDTHTLNYLSKNYDIDAVGICRDQTSTDAYTLIGGYFNQAYYPSKNNIFTPAQSIENQINIPVFRLLGPCPVHNYDSKKYISSKTSDKFLDYYCYTLEPVWNTGCDPKCVDWFYKTYFENEDLGFSYAQLGQENSFGTENFLPALRMQFEKLKELKQVTIQKMGDRGAYYKKAYPSETPATAVVALDSWDSGDDLQSVYYDCKNYMANIFRYQDCIFLRAFYLFDEKVKDLYLSKKCETFDAVYENLPLVDTLFWNQNKKKKCGLVIDDDASSFSATKQSEGELLIEWKGGKVLFNEDKITVYASNLKFYLGNPTCDIKVTNNRLEYFYKGTSYFLDIENANIKRFDDHILITPEGEFCILYPRQVGKE